MSKRKISQKFIDSLGVNLENRLNLFDDLSPLEKQLLFNQKKDEKNGSKGKTNSEKQL